VTPDFSQPQALFGGSFDPVHLGHLHVAANVAEALPGWQVNFVPAHLSPGKPPPLASGADRLLWLEKAVAGIGFGVWDSELRRQGISYTADTLAEARRLGAQSDRLAWITGADAYASLPEWKDSARLRSLCRIIVVNRPGHPVEPQNAADLILSIPPHDASSTAVRAGLAASPPLFNHLPDGVRSELERMILLSQNPYARKSQ
jgi:nicotinate-nucleotide adenylyltransferase